MADVEQRLNRVAEFAERARTLAERWESDELISLSDDIAVMVAFCEMNLPNYALTHIISGTAPVRKETQRDEICEHSRIGDTDDDVHG
jgi:hypothetical protein